MTDLTLSESLDQPMTKDLWQVREYRLRGKTEAGSYAAIVAQWEHGPIGKPWKAWALAYGREAEESWHATSREAKAAAEAYLRSHS